MIEVNIPGFGELRLAHLLLDYNGTLALDGILIADVLPLLNRLSKVLQLHIITGDSYGTAKNELAGITNCNLTILPANNQASAKQSYLKQLNAKETVAIGNGRNDELMLKESALGIAILGGEGTAIAAAGAASIVVLDIFTALNLLLYPRRLVATLRS